MKNVRVGMVLAVLFCFGFAGAAKADTLVVGDMTFTGTVTSTTATLTVQCTDAACAGWFLGDVTLKGFTFTGTPTNGTPLPAGYSVMNGGQSNSGPGSGGGCNSTQPDKAVCFDVTLPNTTALGNGVWTFTADITDGSVSGPLHVQATAYSNSAELDTQKTFAVSCDFGSTSCSGTPPTSTPEPASLTLLGFALIGAPLLRRRRS